MAKHDVMFLMMRLDGVCRDEIFPDPTAPNHPKIRHYKEQSEYFWGKV